MMLAYMGAALFYVGAALVTALAGFLLEIAVWTRLGGTPAIVSGYATVLPVLAAVGLGLRDDVFGYKCALFLSIALGLCLGVHLGLFRSKRAKKTARSSA